MATKQQKRNGKTVGIYIDEHDYEVYSGLGLRDRKRVLEAAREALLAALADKPVKDRPVAGESPAAVAEVVQTVPVVPAVAVVRPDPVTVDAPVVGDEDPTACEPMAEEKPAAADTPDTGLKGFLDAGW
jgi:hypothetical protein